MHAANSGRVSNCFGALDAGSTHATSGVIHAVPALSSFARARPTFSRISSAAFVHTIGLGSSLWASLLRPAGLAPLSLNNVVIGFVLVAGSHTRSLVGNAYLARVLAAAAL